MADALVLGTSSKRVRVRPPSPAPYTLMAGPSDSGVFLQQKSRFPLSLSSAAAGAAFCVIPGH